MDKKKAVIHLKEEVKDVLANACALSGNQYRDNFTHPVEEKGKACSLLSLQLRQRRTRTQVEQDKEREQEEKKIAYEAKQLSDRLQQMVQEQAEDKEKIENLQAEVKRYKSGLEGGNSLDMVDIQSQTPTGH